MTGVPHVCHGDATCGYCGVWSERSDRSGNPGVCGMAGPVLERNDAVGGAAASADVFGDGSIVDMGAAAHPCGVASPIFRHLGV